MPVSPRAPFSMTLSLVGEVRRKGKWYVACCPVFDVVTQGETERKAVANLTEALREFLLSCFERGTIDEVLKDAGLMPVSEYFPRTTRTSRNHTVPLQIELPFVRQIPGTSATAVAHR